MERAACLREDPEMFFPDKTELHTKANDAITVCFGCRVRSDCEKYRKRTGSNYGIWAGKLQQR